MKTPIFSPRESFFSLFCIICCILLSVPVNGQASCPNPVFPTCQPPRDQAFKVLLILDESGSVLEVEATFEGAVKEFARALNQRVAKEGQFEMGIVEFNRKASFAMPFIDVKQGDFRSQVDRYLDIDFNPTENTSYRDALKTAKGIPNVDIIFFISDGGPNFGDTASDLADEIKCSGTYIFGIALGKNVRVNNIQAICGTDEMSGSMNLMQGADWMQKNVDGLADALVDLANAMIDDHAPVITCPDDITVNCEADTEPNISGTPETSDNCAVAGIEHEDVETDGDCGNNFSIARTWTVTDANGNSNRCEQIIEVIDETPPVISGPAKIIVSCDTSVLAIGLPTVQDNCDAGPIMTYKDEVVAGDCDWRCQIERTWASTDACGNTATFVQEIEKDITPLLKQAVSAGTDGNNTPNPMVLGVTQTTLTINQEHISCILDWMPYNGNTPIALRRGKETVDNNCAPGTNAVDQSGKITNPLFGEALRLALYLRLHPEFGQMKIADIDCIPGIVQQNLSNNPDVDEFMSLANKALGNLVLVPHLQELLDAFGCINVPMSLCDTVEEALVSDDH